MYRLLFFCLLLVPLPALAGEDTVTHPPLKSWLPDDNPQAVIIALHSFGDFSDAFAHVGPWFAERGIAVFAWDQRGFGDNANTGHWPGGEVLEADLRYYLTQLSDQYNAPIFVLGESLGGAVAINVAAREPDLPIDGLILAAPAVREGINLRYGWNFAIGAAALVKPGHLLDVERRADDPRFHPASARRLAEAPRVHRQVRMDAYQGLIRYADRASNIADQLKTPTLLMYGGKDNSVPAVSIQRLHKHLGVHGDYYFFAQGPHLLLQGKDWETVAERTLLWLHNTHAFNAQNPDQLVFKMAN